MENVLLWFLFVCTVALILYGIGWACDKFQAPLFARWIVGGLVIIILLFGLAHVFSGGGPHLPKW